MITVPAFQSPAHSTQGLVNDEQWLPPDLFNLELSVELYALYRRYADYVTQWQQKPKKLTKRWNRVLKNEDFVFSYTQVTLHLIKFHSILLVLSIFMNSPFAWVNVLVTFLIMSEIIVEFQHPMTLK